MTVIDPFSFRLNGTSAMHTVFQEFDAPGQGFTHKVGDIVTIAAPQLGRLVNRMKLAPDCEPWTFGTGALMRNLAARGLLQSP